jgi:hypothetical protein
MLRTAHPPRVTEKAFMAAVIDYATLRGWRHFHAHEMRRSDAGWPDLVLLRPPRIIFVELKVGRNRLTPAQREWLVALDAVPGVESYIWYCTEDTWREIERRLR